MPSTKQLAYLLSTTTLQTVWQTDYACPVASDHCKCHMPHGPVRITITCPFIVLKNKSSRDKQVSLAFLIIICGPPPLSYISYFHLSFKHKDCSKFNCFSFNSVSCCSFNCWEYWQTSASCSSTGKKLRSDNLTTLYCIFCRSEVKLHIQALHQTKTNTREQTYAHKSGWSWCADKWRLLCYQGWNKRKKERCRDGS